VLLASQTPRRPTNDSIIIKGLSDDATLCSQRLQLRRGDRIPTSSIRFSARDRRLAAIHEAGHLVIGRHLGLSSISSWLEKVPNTEFDEKLWIGHTKYMRPSPPLGKTQMTMFSVAGSVAKCCWNNDAFCDTIDNDRWCAAEVMSQSDWDGCGCTPGHPTKQMPRIIERPFALLKRKDGPLWPPLLSEARQLIEGSRFMDITSRPLR
jgi:hypothetical protein